MKSFGFPFIVLLSFLCNGLAENEHIPLIHSHSVSWADVPEPVQRAIKSQSGNASVVGVRQGEIDGQPIYVGSFQRDAQMIEIPIKADGTLYTSQNLVAWNEIPTAVQDSFQSTHDLASLQSVSRQITGGHTIYIFSILTDGVVSRQQFAEDGTFIGALDLQPMPVSAESVGWNDLPLAVQKSATAQAQSAEIADVTRATLYGEPVYQITAFDQSGQKMQFRVSENGTVLGRATITEAAGANRPKRIRGLSMDELPLPVQGTMKSFTGVDRIDSIQPTFVNGRICYEIGYRRNNGLPVSVCVAEDGQVVK